LSDIFLDHAVRPAAVEMTTRDRDPSFDTPMPGGQLDLECHGDVAHVLRARGDVELLLTKGELERLLRQAVAAAEASPGWGPGREFVHKVTDDAHVFAGFEASSFTLVHAGAAYDILYYDGFSTEFVQ